MGHQHISCATGGAEGGPGNVRGRRPPLRKPRLGPRDRPWPPPHRGGRRGARRREAVPGPPAVPCEVARPLWPALGPVRRPQVAVRPELHPQPGPGNIPKSLHCYFIAHLIYIYIELRLLLIIFIYFCYYFFNR